MSLVNLTKVVILVIISSMLSIFIYRYFFTIEKNTLKTEAKERQVLYWYDPMYPSTKFAQPGKSPFMDMDLMPKYADENTDSTHQNGIRINPAQIQNLGLKTTEATWGKTNYDMTFPAEIVFNDHQFAVVQARDAGFVEKVYPLAIGEKITVGTPLVDLTIPAWVETQSEYLALKAIENNPTNLNSVLERLRLNGMPEESIKKFVNTGKVQTRFIIKAPISGVITALNLRLGMNVTKDAVIAQIQGTDPLWVNASLSQSTADLLDNNVSFSLSIPAFPTHKFVVTDWVILPSADVASRTINIRAKIDNKKNLLKPGMTAYLNLIATTNEAMLIPSQSIVDSGKEQHVIAVGDNGEFIPKKVKVIREYQQMTAISEGLEVGEKIVTQGIFLIDSEANISGALERMREKTEDHASVGHSAHKMLE